MSKYSDRLDRERLAQVKSSWEELKSSLRGKVILNFISESFGEIESAFGIWSVIDEDEETTEILVNGRMIITLEMGWPDADPISVYDVCDIESYREKCRVRSRVSMLDAALAAHAELIGRR